jgi:hypothetical protein
MKRLVLAALLAGLVVPAWAGNPVYLNSNHDAPAVIVTGTVPGSSARNFPGCTVGTVSTQCLAAGTVVNFVGMQNTSSTALVACAWGAAAVLNSSTSIQLTPGAYASWGPNTAGVPSGALNCIASVASSPLYLEWN